MDVRGCFKELKPVHESGDERATIVPGGGVEPIRIYCTWKYIGILMPDTLFELAPANSSHFDLDFNQVSLSRPSEYSTASCFSAYSNFDYYTCTHERVPIKAELFLPFRMTRKASKHSIVFSSKHSS